MPPARPLGDVLGELQTDPTDEDAWGDLYRQMWPYLLRQSHQCLGWSADINDSEDLAQEVIAHLRGPYTSASCNCRSQRQHCAAC